jgi:hypothetical protein
MSELRTNKIYPRDGLPAGASGGGIIQMVQSKFPSSVSTSVQTTWINNHSISITPTSASNKVLFMWNGEVYGGGVGILRVSGRVRRGSSTTIWENSDLYFRESSGQMKAVCPSICYLDSPATTSSVTYYFDSYIIQGLEWFMDADANFLTLMEVSG